MKQGRLIRRSVLLGPREGRMKGMARLKKRLHRARYDPIQELDSSVS